MTYSRRVRNYVGILAALAVSLCAQTAPAEMTVKGYTPATAGMYDRFLNDPAFIGSGYNWSGVGRGIWTNSLTGITVPVGGWGTMISPSYFVSASHFNPENLGGNALRFYHTNDPAGTFEDRSFTPVGQIANSDLWIGKLNAPVSNNVAKYPVISLPTNTSYANLPLHIFGMSTTIGYGTDISVRLGTNAIDAHNAHNNGTPVTQQTIGGTTGFTYTFNYPPGAPNGEALLQVGDSGAPNFYLLNGNMPTLIGINWYSLSSPDGSGSTAVPKYLTALQSAMTTEFLSIVKTSAVLGDFNLDGTLNAADVKAMSVALIDLNSYKSLHGINQQYLVQMGDLNGDFAVNNADLQPLLNLLSATGGGGNVEVVPEPASIVLFGFGCLAVAGRILRKRKICAHKPRGCNPWA